MMSRYDTAYGRNDYGGGNEFGLFSSYPTAQVAPPPAAVPAPFSTGPPPPSLMSLSAVPPLMPPPSVPAPLPMAPQSSLPPPSVVPPPSHLSTHNAPIASGGFSSGSAGMSSAGVNTNSKHPMAVKARVFIGNLNTNVVTRDEFEQLYRRFGEVLAVSMHRGYGFIQYQSEYEARNAVSFTDGMVLAGQRLDVNLASEPKPGRETVKPTKRQAESNASEGVAIKRSRPNSEGKGPASNNAAPKPLFPSAKSSSNVEVTTTDSAPAPAKATTATKSTPTKAAAAGKISSNLAVLTKKEPTTATGKVQAAVAAASKAAAATVKTDVNGADSNPIPCTLAPGANESSADILICGQCRSLFNTINAFTAHKKENGSCIIPTNADAKEAADKNTTTSTSTATKPKAEGEPDTLLCYVCQKSFENAWNLVSHIGMEHGIVLYQTSSASPETTEKEDTTKEKALLDAVNAAKETVNNNGNEDEDEVKIE